MSNCTTIHYNPVHSLYMNVMFHIFLFTCVRINNDDDDDLRCSEFVGKCIDWFSDLPVFFCEKNLHLHVV